MTDRLLLDTHIALWLDSGDKQLRGATRARIDECWRGGGTIFLSAVSAWELALLADTGRIALDVPAPEWIGRFLGRPGLAPAPLTCRAAARSYQLLPLEHRDPADRLLVATAIELNCSLVTYDARIVRFAKRYGRQYDFAVEGLRRPA
ncbi:MAG: type II toxin-antitoxin system VapC family toxin [Terriglobales bacterium]